MGSIDIVMGGFFVVIVFGRVGFYGNKFCFYIILGRWIWIYFFGIVWYSNMVIYVFVVIFIVIFFYIFYI